MGPYGPCGKTTDPTSESVGLLSNYSEITGRDQFVLQEGGGRVVGRRTGTDINPERCQKRWLGKNPKLLPGVVYRNLWVPSSLEKRPVENKGRT